MHVETDSLGRHPLSSVFAGTLARGLTLARLDVLFVSPRVVFHIVDHFVMTWRVQVRAPSKNLLPVR